MNAPVNAFAAFEKGASLRPYTYDAGPLGVEQVEIAVTHCGICHGDFPMTRVNEAIGHLRAGQARYRVVLENDLG